MLSKKITEVLFDKISLISLHENERINSDKPVCPSTSLTRSAQDQWVASK